MNKVILSGRLVADPDTRTTQAGQDARPEGNERMEDVTDDEEYRLPF